MTWNGTAQRIYGDFANATHASRTLFQDKTTNNTTSVGVMPNGTGATAQLLVYGGSDPDNTHRVSLQAGSTANIINSVAKGTGAVKPFAIQMNSSNAVYVDTNKNVASGVASLATTATDGFPYIPTCAGTPTGVPTSITGFAPMVFDTTNDKLYIYGGAAWIAIN
jgi:hypothetical protein